MEIFSIKSQAKLEEVHGARRSLPADHDERLPRGAAACVILVLSTVLWLVIIHLA